MAISGFESLSVELRLMILQQLSSPRDLYRLICTSRACYYTFIGHKTSILAAVIQTAIPREVLPDALAACEASEIRAISILLPSKPREIADTSRGRITRYIQDFMDGYRAQPKATLSGLTDLPVLVSLCRLWEVVDFFISDYKKTVFKQMAHLFTDATQHHEQRAKINYWADQEELSTTEVGRLQRAFFRFETYRKLFAFGQNQSEYYPIMGSYFHSTLFLKRFPGWQEEEITCIYDYLTTYAQGILDKLEDDFVNMIKVMALETPKDCEPTFSIDKTWLDLSCHLPFMKSNKQQYHEVLILRMPGLGLPYMKRLPFLNVPDRLNLIFQDSITLFPCKPTIAEVFQRTRDPYSVRDLAPARACGVEPFVEALTECNKGWRWVSELDPENRDFRSSKHAALKAMGYVFWDETRLNEMRLFDTSDQDLQLSDHKDQLSVEERLDGVVLSHALFSEEFAEYNLTIFEQLEVEKLEY
ncbi:hypothetical protein MMC19_003992 [Ptychographa xylographoides]|nr:hypothetical protein [Ptychographa xylographoides]